MRVLIVEDEKRLAQALGQIMEEQHYQVDIVYDGADGLDYALSGQYDIVILDVMLPKKDGFEVVHELREQKISTPVLMLTARDDISDKVQGLDCGADDYMTKPFSPEELLARIRALSRRQGDVLLEDIHWADLTLKLSSRTLHCGAKSVSLGFKEFEVLKILLANPNGIVSKEELIVKVWGSDSNAEDRDWDGAQGGLSSGGKCVNDQRASQKIYPHQHGSGGDGAADRLCGAVLSELPAAGAGQHAGDGALL